MKGEPCSSERQMRCSWLSEQWKFHTTPKDPPHRLVWGPRMFYPILVHQQSNKWNPKEPAKLSGGPRNGTPSRIPQPLEIVWPIRPIRGEGHPPQHFHSPVPVSKRSTGLTLGSTQNGILCPMPHPVPKTQPPFFKGFGSDALPEKSNLHQNKDILALEETGAGHRIRVKDLHY